MDWRIERRRRGQDRLVDTTHVETLPSELLATIEQFGGVVARLSQRIDDVENAVKASGELAPHMLNSTQAISVIDARIKLLEANFSALTSAIQHEAKRRGAA
jgi:prefoldin subunit 5